MRRSREAIVKSVAGIVMLIGGLAAQKAWMEDVTSHLNTPNTPQAYRPTSEDTRFQNFHPVLDYGQDALLAAGIIGIIAGGGLVTSEVIKGIKGSSSETDLN